jgi:uncharacterized protein YbjT (DUF2867 family)
MADKKVIAVVGATGAQGGGLVQAIVNDPGSDMKVRVLTRNQQSEKAKALTGMGVEVMQADLDDLESLKRAFAGTYGAFCVTNFWEHSSPEKELKQAAAQAEAAKAAGVRHVIWSTLEDTRRWVPLSDNRMPTLMEKYKVPHFDAKGEADREFSSRGVPTTFLLTSFYWDNLIFFGMGPKKGPDGALVFALPMGTSKLPGIAAGDIGRCALGIFKKGREYVGKTVAIAGELLSGTEMAQAMTEAIKQPVRYQDMSPEAYRNLGFPGADDLGNMFQFKRDFNKAFCEPRDPAFARSLNPSLQSFAAWLGRNKSRIPLS